MSKQFLFICSFLTLSCESQKPALNLFQTHTQQQNIRTLTNEEKQADFDQLLSVFKAYYGPYSYKEKRFSMSISELAESLKQKSLQAKTDEEFMGYLMQFGAALKDGHVQMRLENSASNIRRYSLPISLGYIENKAIVTDVNADFSSWSGISAGDELISIDGKTVSQLLNSILKYRSFATELSNQQMIAQAAARPSYMTDLLPTSAMASLQLKSKDGIEYHVEAPWVVGKYTKTLDSLIRGNQIDLSVPYFSEFNEFAKDFDLAQMGAVNPFFVNQKTINKFGLVKVFPSEASLKKFGLKGDEKPGIYAALYRFKQKTFLLVRSSSYAQSDYSGSVYVKAYQALLSEYENLVDGLVLDQTHNPGGSYCSSFYEVFARTSDVQGVELLHADRKWINDLYINWPTQEGPNGNPWDISVLQAWGTMVEKAYDSQQEFSEPVPLFSGTKFVTPKQFIWKKPMIVLIDELAGSCGDMFPMLVKANKRALLFGQQTMGLGGNVEPVATLNHSRISISLTRGLFYPYNPNRGPLDSEFIENNGVLPDVSYEHTVSDFRSGYIQYVQSFSEVLAGEIEKSQNTIK